MPFARLSISLWLLVLASACSEEDVVVPPPPVVCDCDDGDPCTDDVCSEDGCLHFNVSLRDACLYDSHCLTTCVVGSCEPVEGCGFSRCVHREFVCDDGDPCTSDLCDEGLGCRFERLGSGVPCAAGCDDGIPCTDDGCETIIGCGDFCTHTPNGCDQCETRDDCSSTCTTRDCIAGVCVYGAHESPYCDWRCNPASSTTPDKDRMAGLVRGIAAPPEACSDCGCTQPVVLRGRHRDLTLVQEPLQAGVPWGTCDTCGDATTCSPLVVGRGYYIYGLESLALGDFEGTPVGPFVMSVNNYCLAVHSYLMLGNWRMTLTLADTTTAFDARVTSADEGPTRFEIDGTTDGVGVPAQTLLLPNGQFHLDTRLVTDRGELVGTLYSGPDAIAGEVVGADGGVGVLRIELAP